MAGGCVAARTGYQLGVHNNEWRPMAAALYNAGVSVAVSALTRAATFAHHFHMLGVRSAQRAHHLDAAPFGLVSAATVVTT